MSYAGRISSVAEWTMDIALLHHLVGQQYSFLSPPPWLLASASVLLLFTPLCVNADSQKANDAPKLGPILDVVPV